MTKFSKLLLTAGGLLLPAMLFSQAKEDKIELTYSLNGKEMYTTWCASCHGADGKGKGPAATALKKAPPDLTLLAKHNGGNFPVDRVRGYIEGTAKADAHGSREMPVWGDVFKRIANSEGAIQYRVVTLTNYVASLQEK
jgi:mono/diheme cytochrome c family protein